MVYKINCLIVEDEPIAAEVIEDYIVQVPHLRLVATCRDALFALEVLQRESIDLIFLDIHLPKLKGVDFVKTLKQKPYIIFTTAYHEYAIEGFNLEVLDYLLKPIAFSRFLQAVNRIPKVNLQNNSIVQSQQTLPPLEYIFFNVNKKQVKIVLDDILYMESLKDYVRIFSIQKNIVIKSTLLELTKLLPKKQFVRVHRSYIVSVNKITAYSYDQVEIDTHRIPIGRSYKKILKEVF